MDSTKSVALYARVSSQSQADEATIQSQVAALKQRITADKFRIDLERCFLDDGYSGSTMQRPALERLRDLIHTGGIDRLYVHSPDRLARKFVYQTLLLEEFAKRHVDVVFLNQPKADESPEGNLLLQMQGMIAEYERAKILERTRRGRRFNARQGRVSVLGHAPYGYRYVTKHDGNGEARYEIVPEEAKVVRELFRWVAVEGASLGETMRRLAAQNIPTRTGLPQWDRATLRGILLNPAYYGEAHWGKTRLEERTSNRRPSRGQPDVPRQSKVARPLPSSEHELIPVPGLISKDLFTAAADRLEENRRRQRTRQSGATFLLSGLLVCGGCGAAYCGRHYKKGEKRYVYYRCLGTDKYRNGGTTLCSSVACGREVEDQVWADACSLLQDPGRLRRELQRRQQPSPQGEFDPTSLRSSIAGLKRQLSRLLDMYEAGHLEKAEFETRIRRVKGRLECEEKEYTDRATDEQRVVAENTLLSSFQQFAEQMKTGLGRVDFAAKRKLLSLLIKRIEVGDAEIQIVYKVQPHPTAPSPNGDDLQHRLKSGLSLSG
jgi:site-specific DNA recombinase